MKRILIILTIISGAMFSCAPLDTKPKDFVAPQFYFSTEAEINNALTGVYDILGNSTILYVGNDGLLTYFDAADQMFHNSSDRPPVYIYSAADSWPLSLWQTLYRGIERANLLLVNIDKPEMSEEKRKILKGEAQFLRAYYYFVLVQNFGAVPLRTNPTASVSDIYFERTPAAEVYDFIYQEMVEAEGLVQPITNFNHAGRVTKSAIQGVLARVSLYMAGIPNNRTEKFKDALQWSAKVIDSKLHDLNPNYAQIFINLIQNKYDTKESIWEVECYTTGATDPYGETGSLGINNGIRQDLTEYGFGGPQYRVHEKYYKLFEEIDTRRDWNIAPYTFAVNSNPPVKQFWTATQIYDRFIGKYRREYELVSDKIKNNTGTNFSLVRYADVLLMAAEAENEVNGPTEKAIGYLNAVRKRAGVKSVTTFTGKEDFRKMIQDERSRELGFEGWRRLDLIRWGIFLSTMKALVPYVQQTAPATHRANASRAGQNVAERHIYLPIPLRELSLNKLLTQNPGW